MQEIVIGKRSYKVESSKEKDEVIVNGQPRKADLIGIGDGHYHLILDGKSTNIEIVSNDSKTPTIKVNGNTYQPEIKDETDLLLERLGMNVKAKKEVKELKAPMPGLVLDIRVKPGDEIKEGEPLIVLEAMKMENVLKAPVDVIVKAIAVQEGDALDKNTLLITFQ